MVERMVEQPVVESMEQHLERLMKYAKRAERLERLMKYAELLVRILGNPKFRLAWNFEFVIKLADSGPDEVLKSTHDALRSDFGMDESQIPVFQACVRVVCKLAGSSTLKPEELAGDVRIWDSLISDCGMAESDVRTLQAYAHPSSSSPPLGEDQERNRVEVEQAHLSFTDFPFKGGAHIHLHEQLLAKREEVHISTHYSPYVALVQASGVGKSRAVMQMSSLDVYICYCSLAGEYSSASPPRTGKLADKLSSTFHEYDMVLYLKAWLKVLDDSISNGNITSDAWKLQQLPNKDGSPRGDVAKRVHAEWERLLAQKDHNSENKRDPVAANIDTCRTEVTAIKAHFKKPCSVLFVFDEARGLQKEDPKSKLTSQSPFNQIRRALRVFFHERVFFALFLDTAARVSNLLPNKANEDSERALKMGISLLKPIYCLPNMGLYRPLPGLTAEEYWDPENWLMYGRPLWAARWSKSPSIKNLLAFAQQKLLCTLQGDFDGVSVDVGEGIMTQSQAIALLSAAAGLSICARSMLAERLAASHMNLILRVTESNIKERRIYVGLSAEPILAEAAGSILGPAKVQEAALKHLDKAYLAGYVTPGPRGEFVTKFILVAAVWHLKQDWILQPIPVVKFLKTLLGPEVAGVLNSVKGGFVFFNSFVIIRRPPGAADLGKAFAAGYAFMYMAENRLPGADLILPLWTSKGMTAIVFSAKNVQNAKWLQNESVAKVKSEYTHVEVAEGLPSVTVLMSLREPQMKDSESWVHWDSKDPNYIHLTCYGIDQNYSFLDDTVKALLKKVLVTVPDELSDATDTEKKFIMSMLPEQFEPSDSTYSYITRAEQASGKRRKVEE